MMIDEATLTELRAKLERYIAQDATAVLTSLEARMLHMTLQHWMTNPPTFDKGPPL